MIARLNKHFQSKKTMLYMEIWPFLIRILQGCNTTVHLMYSEIEPNLTSLCTEIRCISCCIPSCTICAHRSLYICGRMYIIKLSLPDLPNSPKRWMRSCPIFHPLPDISAITQSNAIWSVTKFVMCPKLIRYRRNTGIIAFI